MTAGQVVAASSFAGVPRTSARPVTARIFWMTWTLLAAMILLNANSILVLAGAPERYFSPFILIVALSVFFIRSAQATRLSQPPMPAVLVFCAAFVLVGAFSATNSSHATVDDAIVKLPLYAASALMMLASAFTASWAAERDQITLLLKTLFWPCVLAALSGVAFISLPSLANVLALQPGERLHGVFGNTNELGAQAGYALLLGLVISMRTKSALWVVVGTLAAIVGVISSFSKSSILGLLPLFALMVYAASGARFRLKPMLILAVTSAVVGVGVIMLAGALADGDLPVPLSTDQRMRLTAIVEIISSGALDESATTGRSAVWKMGLEHWSASPVMGLGLSAFDHVRGIDMEIHNTFLRVLGESGIIGMTAFVVMLISLIITVAREKRPDVHVLGLGLMLVLFPAVMSTGGILLSKNHDMLFGCLVGLLMSRARAERAGAYRTGDVAPLSVSER